MISSNITGVAAYAKAQAGLDAGDGMPAASDSSFGAVLQGAVTGLSELGQNADAKSAEALSGSGSMTDVVMAVSKAEMALNASVAVRDKVISAYQEIMRMAV